MIGQMAVVMALPGFNDLGLSVTAILLCPKINKRSRSEVKKIQDFCPGECEFCYRAAARRVKPWPLNANLFFKARFRRRTSHEPNRIQ